ncbi:MAG: hypothetical protein HY841_04305 [Bacteroidetes bacterium]|nr:hypothetical protein [Bacteroidota bacterium]
MTDLTPYFNRLDILNDTAKQIIKDFGMAGLEIKFSGTADNAYAELFAQILPHIEKMLTHKNSPLLRREAGAEAFYNLMYRIDISETQIKKAVEQATDKSFSEVVTDLILKRELLKVITRKNYSAGKEL